MSVPPRVCRILTPPPMAVSGSSLETVSASAASQALAASTSLSQRERQPPSSASNNNNNTTATSHGNKPSRSMKPGEATSSAAAVSNGTSSSTASQFSQIQRHVTLHPVLPWATYVLEQAGVNNNTTPQSPHKVLVVQDLTTQQILWSLTWMDLAACLYHAEQSAAKLPSAAKSLGGLVHLDFCDPMTVYWSGMSPSPALCKATAATTADSTSALPSAAYLLVQTTHRCLVLHLRASPYRQCVVWTQAEPVARNWARRALLYAHLEPASLVSDDNDDGAGDANTANSNNSKLLPSSNWLPLSASLYLVGCSDGSLQCWNVAAGQVVKSIRGLGGSSSSGDKDWITLLRAANPYARQVKAHVGAASTALFGATTSSITGGGGGDSGSVTTDETAAPATERRRILAVTRKGLAYLMEIEWHIVPSAATNNTESSSSLMIDIKPPLARFVGGVGTWNSSEAMEHALFHYDAHRDWIFWLNPSSSSSASSSKSKTSTTSAATNSTTLLMWNLKSLEKEIGANTVGGAIKSILKPEPSLTVQFPSVPEDAVMTVLPTLLHTSFHEDTVVCAVTTTSGEFWLQAASTRSRNATALSIVGVHLSPLLEDGAGLDQAPIVNVHGLATQPLGDKPMLAVTTNLGIVVLELPCSTGDRHLHLGAGLGTFGKSILSVQNSELLYGSVDVLKANPHGLMEPKNPVSVYDIPPPVHLPIDYQKRPFRLAPTFLLSPSGLYVCLFNQGEFRYEILHLPSLLQRVGQQRGSSSSGGSKPLVASGTGIASFAWVGDDDCYAILHADEWMNEASMLMTAAAAVPAGESSSTAPSSLLAGVTSTTKKVGGAAALVGGATINLTKAAKSTTMAAATGATKAATIATTTATKTAVSGLKKGAKLATFGVFSKKKKKGGDDDTETEMGMSSVTEDVDEAGPSLEILQAGAPLPVAHSDLKVETAAKKRFVELRTLIVVETAADLAVGNIPAATSSSLGNVMLRGGGQNLPVMLFGGPVLCIASQSDGSDSGHAHFYTLKPDEKENHASLYVSTGPTLPFPDHCVWDDDGVLCAVVFGNRISIYLSQSPEFLLLGCVRIGSGSVIQNVKFIHGTLFCCTWNSIYCVLLGDLDGQVCNLDSYTLASSWILGRPEMPLEDGEYRSLSPPCLPLPLVQPAALGYQNGSLLISTARGVFSLPLNHPILRIGLLLASGQVERASKWLDAFPDHDHEPLAMFLERRGQIDLAVEHLNALSLETIIDLSMRHGLVERLCQVVDEFGVRGIRSVDQGRGYSSSGIFGPVEESQSLVVCVGAYLLAHGKMELVRRLASELLRQEDGRKDALILATLLLQVGETDAARLMGRAVEGDYSVSDWAVGAFVRDNVLRQNVSR